MLSFVPVTFDTYRPVARRLRWTLQHLVAHIGQVGRSCFASVRTLARIAGCSKSTMSRHLADLVEAGHARRRRRPGGCYEYTVDERFLPAHRGVSHSRKKGVPEPRTEEKIDKKKDARGRASFARPGKSFSEMPDDRAKWTARLRSWRQSRFWLPLWGPKPGEPGCFAPPGLLMEKC